MWISLVTGGVDDVKTTINCSCSFMTENYISSFVNSKGCGNNKLMAVGQDFHINIPTLFYWVASFKRMQ